jgi:hypothetical protein
MMTMTQTEMDAREARRAARRAAAEAICSTAAAHDSKACGCGRDYTRASFLALPLAANGVSEMGDLIVRNCYCGSTLVLSK